MTTTGDTDTLVSHEEIPESTRPDDVTESGASAGCDITDVTCDVEDNVVKHGNKDDSVTQIRQNIVELSNGEAHGNSSDGGLQKVEYGTIPVCYSSMYGVYVVRKPIVRTQHDGSRVIDTPHYGETGFEDRPLRAKDITFVKIASVVAMVVFFPLGIPAFWFALKAKQDFAKISENEQYMVTAKKRVKISERFILFSIVVGVLFYILIIAIIQRNKDGWQDHQTNLHWTH